MWILLTAIMTLLWEKFNLSEVKIQVSENVVHVSDCTDQFFFSFLQNWRDAVRTHFSFLCQA